jgi:hypothetical protein
MDIRHPFLGNGSVNTFPEQQIEAQQWKQDVISKGHGYSLVSSQFFMAVCEETT